MPNKVQTLATLASEILSDAELGKSNAEALVLKAARLARFSNNDEIWEWLYHERFGYHDQSETSLRYMALTGRWINKDKNLGYWGPISQQESLLSSKKIELDAIKNFIPNGQYSSMQLGAQQKSITDISSQIMVLARIISCVKALIHNFATKVYETYAWSYQAQNIFDKYKASVDQSLSDISSDTIARIPHIYERLSSEEPEAISHALTSCRRLIDHIADDLFPEGTTNIDVNGETLDVTRGKTRNRVRATVKMLVRSQSRIERMIRIFNSLYDRVSTGVHSDVEIDEAKALIIQMYLFLGEFLALPCFQLNKRCAQ